MLKKSAWYEMSFIFSLALKTSAPSKMSKRVQMVFSHVNYLQSRGAGSYIDCSLMFPTSSL